MFRMKTMPQSSGKLSQEEAEAFSRQEGRKVIVMCVLFGITAVYVTQLLFPGPIERKKQFGKKLDDQVMVQLKKKMQEQGTEVKPFVQNPGVLESAKDFELDQFEDTTLHYFLHRVHNKETKESLEKQCLDVDSIQYKSFVKPEKCAEMRGRTLRLNGRIISSWQRVLATYPNDSGLAWVWQHLMQDNNGIYMVVITDKDSEPEIGRTNGDIVQIDAVFCKGYRFSSENKGNLAVPLVVGRDFKRMRTKTYDEAYPYPLAYAMTAITLFMVLGAFILFTVISRSDKEFNKQQIALRKQRLSRALNKQKAEKEISGIDSANEATETEATETEVTETGPAVIPEPAPENPITDASTELTTNPSSEPVVEGEPNPEAEVAEDEATEDGPIIDAKPDASESAEAPPTGTGEDKADQ